MIATTQRVPKRRGPTRISEARRGELIDAAIRSIAQVGYTDVTVQSICEAAGFSRGLIGHYFTGKDELLLHAVRLVAQDLEAATRAVVEQAGPDPVDRLHAVVEASFSPPSFTIERVSVWVALAGAARWSEPLAEVYRELWRAYRVAIGRLMTRAAQTRRRTLDADRAALTFSRLIEGFYIGWADDPGETRPGQAKAACHELLDLMFGARRS